METNVVVQSDCMAAMRGISGGSVDCIVTSPPYWALRDYGVAGQLGSEESPESYVARMVEVFREARRVLADYGTLWLNLGDSYAANGSMSVPDGLKSKDLVGIPWRVAFALQADGWYLRQDIIWAKPNPMPESVRDRCTKAHEYIFLLSKRPRYYYDAEAIKEESMYAGDVKTNHNGKNGEQGYGGDTKAGFVNRAVVVRPTRNKRSVWTVPTEPTPYAHFATYPQKLIEPCILAGCPKEVCTQCGKPRERILERKSMVIDRSSRTHPMGQTRTSGVMIEPPESKTVGWTTCCHAPFRPGVVLDPFAGSGTTGVVAAKNQRDYILIELNPEYVEIAKKRLQEAEVGLPIKESEAGQMALFQ